MYRLAVDFLEMQFLQAASCKRPRSLRLLMASICRMTSMIGDHSFGVLLAVLQTAKTTEKNSDETLWLVRVAAVQKRFKTLKGRVVLERKLMNILLIQKIRKKAMK